MTDGGAPYYTATFARTSPARRDAVLSTAIDQFAAKGYAATSINDVAREAGISIGAMYSYFASKEDLFLTVVDSAYALMDTILRPVADGSADVYDYVERMLAACRTFATEHDRLNRLYLTITVSGAAEMSQRVSGAIEGMTGGILPELIDRGKEAGIVADGLDTRTWALCIDNLFMMYQFSFASEYYRERLRIYLGDREPDAVERGIASFIRAALRPRGQMQPAGRAQAPAP